MASQLSEFFKGRKVLVTGGAGFVGSHVVDRLVELGAIVTVPIRKVTQLNNLKDSREKISLIEANLFDRKSTDAVMKGQEYVVHLASAKLGGIGYSMLHHGSIFRDNMLSCINVLDSARCENVKRFIFVSSACVYPRNSKVPIREEEAYKDMPEPTNAGFGWSKLMQEYMTLAFAEEYGMNVGIVRPFNMYGPRDNFFSKDNHVIPALVMRLLDGENPLRVWGTGNQTRSFMFVTDCVGGILQMCAHPGIKGPLNLGSDEEITIKELAELIVELSGIKVQIDFDSTKPDGQPRRLGDSSKAKKLLGFKATVQFREGMNKTLDWVKKERQIRGISG
ncbi:NAD-dependent epimerase/dehydratase family protein [Candidatus Woesearchaeota archaeon]|nr:NAD-dependent epimerase/dehydratase family protein [Candidatus Woesearchaeota archaeon]